MKYLSKDDEAALRVIAERHNLRATTSKYAGQGSTTQLLAALIGGQIVTVMLSDDQRSWLVDWLRAQQVDDPLYATLPAELADQLAAVPRSS